MTLRIGVRFKRLWNRWRSEVSLGLKVTCEISAAHASSSRHHERYLWGYAIGCEEDICFKGPSGGLDMCTCLDNRYHQRHLVSLSKHDFEAVLLMEECRMPSSGWPMLISTLVQHHNTEAMQSTVCPEASVSDKLNETSELNQSVVLACC
jgi:hypothetical protein